MFILALVFTYISVFQVLCLFCFQWLWRRYVYNSLSDYICINFRFLCLFCLHWVWSYHLYIGVSDYGCITL